ncbi:MAG TPA: HlyD family efflux transporter periplasmic adaptor subunit [Kofleriaceae bacterium]|nr:HlyD family efflux transporter periplasmic adaptor subunit [Kofleriaceae bacterium]
MKKKLVIAVSASVAIAAGAAAAVMVAHGRAEAVAVAPGPISEIIIAQGQVAAIAGTAEVRALIDGRVVEVPVHEGDTVLAGQLLARIDTDELDAAIARADAERNVAAAELRLALAGGRKEERKAAEAELVAAKAAAALEETRASRDTELAGNGAVAEAVADESRRGAEVARARVLRAEAERNGTLHGRVEQIDAARAQVAAAQAAYEAAQARLDRAVVVSPVAGIVLSRHVDVGDTAAPGGILFEVADPVATELRIEIEELDALRVGPGMSVTITSPGGKRELGHGTTFRMSPQLGRRTIGATDARLRADSQVRSSWVRWNDDGAALLPIGLRVEARIELPARQVEARVPRGAVKVEGGQAKVEVPGWNLFADLRAVKLGISDGEWVEVQGVPSGTRVVTAP